MFDLLRSLWKVSKKLIELKPKRTGTPLLNYTISFYLSRTFEIIVISPVWGPVPCAVSQSIKPLEIFLWSRRRSHCFHMWRERGRLLGDKRKGEWRARHRVTCANFFQVDGITSSGGKWKNSSDWSTQNGNFTDRTSFETGEQHCFNNNNNCLKNRDKNIG